MRARAVAASLVFTALFSMACALGGLWQAGPSEQRTATPSPKAPAVQPSSPGMRLDAGLDGLQSYRAVMTMKFTGQDASGKAIESILQVMEEIDRAQAVHHLLTHHSQQGQRPGSADIYQQGGAIYLVSSELDSSLAGCVQLTSESLAGRTQHTLRPTDLFQEIWLGERITSGGEQAGDHYALGLAQLRLGSPENMSGNVWLSAGGGYVLRFNGSAQGILSFGAGTTYGQVLWDYSLSDINQVSVSLPPDCLALVQNDLPLPPGALDLTQTGNRLAFQTADAPASVMDFYNRELPAAGWTILKGSGGGQVFQLAAAKDQRSIQISISSLAQSTQVTIISQ